MKKLDNFSNCLDILKHADFEFADNDDIYRTGVIGQFNLTFELAWKALQAVLRLHGAQGAETGSPREILQLGYKLGFVNDSAVWLLMLKKRNASVHIYDEDEGSSDEGDYVAVKGFKLRGYKGTAAEKYAKKFKISFVKL